ncbi:MAG: hypothetical protein KDJ16_18075 [Hyphomicrobiales bacterium]|nr:hypothetical protein [Hyphomicrobiales bacterium]
MIESLSSVSSVMAAKPVDTASVDPAQQSGRETERPVEAPDEPVNSGKPRDGLGTILDIRV